MQISLRLKTVENRTLQQPEGRVQKIKQRSPILVLMLCNERHLSFINAFSKIDSFYVRFGAL